MKGGKNMLYFYSCNVLVKGKLIAQVEGSIERDKRITKNKELKGIKEEIRYKFFMQASQRNPLSLEDVILQFIAFNPL